MMFEAVIAPFCSGSSVCPSEPCQLHDGVEGERRGNFGIDLFLYKAGFLTSSLK